jgi:hypothetical protein
MVGGPEHPTHSTLVRVKRSRARSVEFVSDFATTESRSKGACAMMTNEEARAAVEAELFALKLTQRMTLPDKIAFCESAHRRLVFQSDTDRLREILLWAETWQSLWLPDKLTSGGNADLSIGVTHDIVEPRFRLLWPTWAGILSRIVVAWRAVVGVIFATRRAAMPQNKNQRDGVGGRIAEATGQSVWRPRGSSAG